MKDGNKFKLDQRVECSDYSLNVTDQQNWWISNR